MPHYQMETIIYNEPEKTKRELCKNSLATRILHERFYFQLIHFWSENGKRCLSFSDQFAPYTFQLALYVAFIKIEDIFVVYYTSINSQIRHLPFKFELTDN